MYRKIVKGFLFGFFIGWVVAWASPAFAAGEFYGGWSVGQTTFSDVCDRASAAPGLDCDDTDMGWKLFGGYQATPHLGLELDYVDLGTAELEMVGLNLASLELKGFGLSTLVSAPLSKAFSVFAKVGVWTWDIDVETIFGTFGDDGSDLRFGVGGQFRFQNAVGLRAEWERFEVENEDAADLWSIGLTVAFK